MNRSTEYAFVSLDTTTLKDSMIEMYEELTGQTLTPGSPESIFISWVLAVIQQERALMNYTANQNLPSRAEGENLDALADLFYLKERPEAGHATVTMKFYISEAQSRQILIPQGTRVTDASQVMFWTTDDDVYVPIGSTSVTVPATCTEAGTVGNGYAAGQINAVVDVYQYYSKCENITASDGGSDELTDDEFYDYLKSSMAAYSTAGSRKSYLYHAKAVSSEIADVKAISPSAGNVELYATLEGGKMLSSEVKQAVLDACSADDVRPLTDHVSIKDPIAKTYNINLTYYMDKSKNGSATEMQAAVDAAVASYIEWQSAKMGRDINPSYLMKLVMDCGVKRVNIVAPAFAQVKDGNDGTAPEIAVLGTKTVIDGGYEYE